MEASRKRFEEFQAKRKQASHANLKEVFEENEKLKRPANWDRQAERVLNQIKKIEEKKQAEENGEDYEQKQMLDIQANDALRWKRNSSGTSKSEPGVIDYEAATKKQHDRMIKQLVPDMDTYNETKDKSLPLDTEAGVDRMVESVNKQIEIRSKRSRRRRFDHDADVDYINERNMRFNKKLARHYDKYTAETKRNFERGTAL